MTFDSTIPLTRDTHTTTQVPLLPIQSLGDQENAEQAGWKAELKLQFTDRGDKTVLKHRSQFGPLSIQRPLYPENNICHVYLLHPPGGVVGGDSLNIEATASSGAHVLVTTPGATKFYRSDKKIAKQTQTLTVEEGATLEWLPQENIFFPDCHAKVDTCIYLNEKSRFMGWEMHCFGRPALKEGFDLGAIRGKTEIFLNNQRLLTEQIRLNGGDNFFINNGLRENSMTASFFISNSDESLFELVQSLLSKIQLGAVNQKLTLGVTQIEGLLIIRALADWSELILSAFSQIWQLVRLHWTGNQAELPRIWAT